MPFCRKTVALWNEATTTVPGWPATRLTPPPDRHSWPDELRGVILGLLFIALPLIGIAGMGYMLRKRLSQDTLNPVFMSAVLLALPYSHYAFSRAETWHLSYGIFPLLIGTMTLPVAASPNSRLVLAGALLAATLFVTAPYQRSYQYLLARDDWQTISVGTDILRVDGETACEVALLGMLADRYAPNGDSFVATPLWPGAYALLERKSPVVGIYTPFGLTEAYQRAEIARIEAAAPGFVVVTDHALDGREDMRFKNSQPLIEHYFKVNFQSLETFEFGLRGPHQVYVRTAIGRNATSELEKLQPVTKTPNSPGTLQTRNPRCPMLPPTFAQEIARPMCRVGMVGRGCIELIRPPTAH